MNSSDIIAIVAIVISAIVSVISAVIAFKNNKANIEARRVEMAYERRMEAFREILEAMGVLRMFMSENYPLYRGKPDEFFSELRKQYYKFFSTYQKLRFFVPPSLRDNFTEYSRFVFDFIDRQDFGQVREFGDELRDKEYEIINALQKFLGL
jgi:hypothetical protein